MLYVCVIWQLQKTIRATFMKVILGNFVLPKRLMQWHSNHENIFMEFCLFSLFVKILLHENFMLYSCLLTSPQYWFASRLCTCACQFYRHKENWVFWVVCAVTCVLRLRSALSVVACYWKWWCVCTWCLQRGMKWWRKHNCVLIDVELQCVGVTFFTNYHFPMQFHQIGVNRLPK